MRATERADAGRLRACDLDGCKLALRAEADAVDLESVRGRILVHASDGKIEGRGLSGSFDVEADAGEMCLAIVGLDPARHRVRSDVSAARVELSRGLAVRIEPRASMGEVTVDDPETPGAAAVLEVSTALGAVRVRPVHLVPRSRHEPRRGCRLACAGEDHTLPVNPSSGDDEKKDPVSAGNYRDTANGARF